MRTNCYYNWLIEHIQNAPFNPDSYQLILEKLYDTEFYSLIPMDENRRKDGLALKRKYEKILDIPFDGPYNGEERCSVLEMLIAFSYRIEDDIMYDPDYGDRSAFWFWDMLENLDLTSYDDDNFDEFEVDRILYIFLQRLYSPDGYGGLFYTNDPNIDMRELELWDQCGEYLNEFIFK